MFTFSWQEISPSALDKMNDVMVNDVLTGCEHMVHNQITLSKLSTHIKDRSMLRSAEFAAMFYPRIMPLASFSLMNKEHRNSLTADAR